MKKYFECACKSEGLMVDGDGILVQDSEDGFLEIAFYKYGVNGNKLSWGQRFKLIWQILRTGTCYNDMVILDETDTISLKTTLEELVDGKTVSEEDINGAG